MNILLEKELILYESVIDGLNDRDSLSAFHDYASFISNEGAFLFTHIEPLLKERTKEIKEYEDLYTKILKSIKKDVLSVEKLVIKLGLAKDPMFIDRFQTLHTLLNGGYTCSPSTYFESSRLDFLDILRELYRNEYEKEISKYIILSSNYNPGIEDAVAFKERKKYYSLREEFDKKDSISIAGALVNIVAILTRINTPESKVNYSRASYVGDVRKIHNSIVIANLEVASINKSTTIFSMRNEDIYHYQEDILTYRKRGIKEPKYISMFKNIIRYMPANKSEITLSDFEKLIPKDKQVGDGYRNNLMKDGIFNKFLGNNNVKNIHPKTGQEVLRTTDKFIYFNNNL